MDEKGHERTTLFEKDEAEIEARLTLSCVLSKPQNAFRKSRDVLEERRKCM